MWLIKKQGHSECNLNCYDRPENSQEDKRKRNRDPSYMSQAWENSQSELNIFRLTDQGQSILGCICILRDGN